MPSALPLVKSGELRAIAVTSAHRSPAAPQIPTLAESGLPGFKATSCRLAFQQAELTKWAKVVKESGASGLTDLGQK
ncbi:MAG: hypothetical protein NVS2B4_10250 [Ramlibacter sp.]